MSDLEQAPDAPEPMKGTTDPNALLQAALDMAESIEENEGSYSDDEGDFSEEPSGVLEDEAEGADDSDGHLESGLAAEDPGQSGDPAYAADPEYQAYQQWKTQQRQAEYQQRHENYDRRFREQAPEPAQQGRQPKANEGWALPHELTHDLRMAMGLRGTESWDRLPAAQRQKAEQVHDYVSGNWDRWTYEPGKLVDDLVMPKIMPLIQQVADRMAELQAAEFQRRNPELADQANASQYLDLVNQAQRDPYALGLEVMRMKKALAAGRSNSQETKEKTRDQQAASKGARGRPAKGRSKQRRGKRKRELTKADRTNTSKIADVVMQELIEDGTFSESELK